MATKRNWAISITVSIVVLAIYIGYRFPLDKSDGRQLSLEGNHWVVDSNVYDFPEGLYVPPEVSLEIKPGAVLRFGAGKTLAAHGSIRAIGTKEQPIIFTSIGLADWRGVKLMGKDANFQIASRLKAQWPTVLRDNSLEEVLTNVKNTTPYTFINTVVQNVSVPGPKENMRYNYMAAIEVLGTKAVISENTFENVSKIGAIRAYNSVLVVSRNLIDGAGYRKGIHINNSIALVNENLIKKNQGPEICMDGVWVLGSLIVAKGNKISGQGDDGFDLKNSAALLISNELNDNKDEGFDIDHDSSAIVLKNIVNSSENGIQLSGQSEAVIYENSISSNANAFKIRGESSYIEAKNKLTRNNKDILVTTDETRNVADQGWKNTGEMKGLLLETERQIAPNQRVEELKIRKFEKWLDDFGDGN